MRPRFALVLFVALSLSPAAARAEEPEAFLARWVAAQNGGDFAAYQALYADTFRGVRMSQKKSMTLDRDKWMEDRERMFRKPMVVEVTDVKVLPAPEGKEVHFQQTWASGDYKDVGKKKLLLVETGAAWRIAREDFWFSKRLLLPGQVMEVTIPARTAEEAGTARERFAALAGDLRGVREWPLRLADKPLGVVVASCDREDFAEIADTAQALEPRAVARVVRAAATACPELERSDDADEQWEWPVSAEARVGKRTLTVLVTSYRSTDHGDFGRDRRGYHLVALYRDEKGAAIESMKGESASDFSEVDSVEAKGKQVIVTETYVDAPCDGTSTHRYKKLVRKTTIEPDPSAPDTLRTRSKDKTLERDRCDNSGYKEWLRQMNR